MPSRDLRAGVWSTSPSARRSTRRRPSCRTPCAAAADAPGYPQTWGTPALREAVADWFARRRGVPDLDPAGVLPTIGCKELVAWLPTLLGLGAGDIVGFPGVAYPTYDVGARLAGADPKVVDGLAALGPLTPSTTPKLLWLNSPGNPTGKVLGVEHLAKVVRGPGAQRRRRQRRVLRRARLARAEPDSGDEPPTTPSILDPRVTGGSHEGLLAVYSLSKQSNLAGYRAAFVAGDLVLVRRLLEVRKHAGMIVPWPVQQALAAALGRRRARRRAEGRYTRADARCCVRPSRVSACGSTTPTPACTCGRRGGRTPGRRSARGSPPAASSSRPGTFYGAAGREHVRIALTATDERIEAAAARLA